MIPDFGTYISWTWAIIKAPYTISKWIYSSLQESNRRYKIWKGWKDPKVICFTCTHGSNCSTREDVYAQISACSAYKVASLADESTRSNKQ